MYLLNHNSLLLWGLLPYHLYIVLNKCINIYFILKIRIKMRYHMKIGTKNTIATFKKICNIEPHRTGDQQEEEVTII